MNFFPCSLVICCAFNIIMELPSDKKCAIEKDCTVKIVRQAGEALLFGDASKLYMQKYK